MGPPEGSTGTPGGAQGDSRGARRAQESAKRAQEAPEETWKAKNVKNKKVKKPLVFIGFWPPGVPKMAQRGSHGTIWVAAR